MPNSVVIAAGTFVAGAAGTGVATPAAGDTFTVSTFSASSSAWLEQIWASGASEDFIRVRSPRMHDVAQGIRLRTSATLQRPLLPWGANQKLYPADTPIVEIDETAAATGGILIQYGYDDLPGAQPVLASWEDVQPRIVAISGVQVSVTSGAAGTWGAGVAINAAFDNFEAGAQYALLGYECSAACLGVAITGRDTGNLKVGGPGSIDSLFTRDMFIKQSQETGRARIPVIAADNKGSTLVQNVDTGAATAVVLSLIMAQLG